MTDPIGVSRQSGQYWVRHLQGRTMRHRPDMGLGQTSDPVGSDDPFIGVVHCLPLRLRERRSRGDGPQRLHISMGFDVTNTATADG